MAKTKLVVDVIRAHNLMPKDGKGSSSAYVELYLEGQKFQTTTKEKDLNPVWNEKFYFNISKPENLHDIELQVNVFHITKGTPPSSKSFLGQFWLTATTFKPYSDASVVYYTLEKRGILSRVRGELGLKVGIIVENDDHEHTVKSSPPLYPVLESDFDREPLEIPEYRFPSSRNLHPSYGSSNSLASYPEPKYKDDEEEDMKLHGYGDFFSVTWQQGPSMVKSILSFTFNIFYKILLHLFTWFQQLLFLVIMLVHLTDEKQDEVPNMKIELKLTIDKKKNRVLYVESDKDFVDVLLGFLTLPMGNIIRLAQKKSNIGCMDNLYTSIETLDDKFLQTKACRTMLLNPINPYQVLCNNLIVNVDKNDPAKHYICSNFFCWCVNQNENKRQLFRLASAIKDSQCICGQEMDKEVYLENGSQNGTSNGVFLKETRSFVITDDLVITPSPTSMASCQEMIQKLRVGDGKNIQDMVISIGIEEVLQLLKNSFLSNTPMTHTFLSNEQDIDTNIELFEIQNSFQVNPDSIISRNFTKSKNENFTLMKVKLLIEKSSNKVICLEAEEDFLDNVLSFLTYPLGHVLNILTAHSCSLGSLNNLFTSVEKLELSSSKHKDVLLNPNLAPYYSFDNQVLAIGEENPASSLVATGDLKYNFKKLCLSWFYKKIRIMNPKLWGQVRKGGGFVKKPSSLLIYDDLVIRPCSTTTGVLDFFKNNIQVDDIEIQEVQVGGDEVLALLVASLTCKKTLNSVFRPRL